MSDKPRSFPLPLSSITGGTGGSGGTGGTGGTGKNAPAYGPKPVATPQTATQNARSAPRPQYAAPAVRPNAPGNYGAGRAQPQPLPVTPRPDQMVSDAVRHAMVARVARQGVQDALVLAALAAVPRHRFIEPALSAQAYIDASIPIGHQQTISQPYIVARMIEVMRNGGKLQRVLEIGTGCGYQAAVLACVAQDVYSIERIKPLHELAKSNLRHLRIANLRLHYGDGMLGLPQAAPFDGIILAAAGLEVPQALLDQLAIGGRLVAPVGAQVQHLHLITRSGKSEWTSQMLEGCHFVPLRPGTV